MEQIRNSVDADDTAIVRLNEAEVQQTSPMDLERLHWLVGLSTYSKVFTVGDEVAAFLIAMEDGAAYENDNFGFFAERFGRFLYVDRIVVDARFAGRRIGSRLYDDLFDVARQRDIGTITCEYNIEPPNPASRAFHDKHGFKEVGTQWVAGGTKRVSLQAVSL